ncbi:MAG TPA: DUF3499 domain-containing protein [Candidatus Stackebrandtia faecavium]|nr:DUF3499 domain-containing protein [Candidatus Stackebrandtia faecavium]
MRSHRRCSRNGCRESAVATLTYVYNDSTAVVGPLSTTPEPHIYDLCESHARKLTAPRGWDLVRHVDDYTSPMPSGDDLVALADAVREAAKAPPEKPADVPPPPKRPKAPTDRMAPRRPRLRVVGGDDSPHPQAQADEPPRGR